MLWHNGDHNCGSWIAEDRGGRNRRNSYTEIRSREWGRWRNTAATPACQECQR
jgi:hypothetical protein